MYVWGLRVYILLFDRSLFVSIVSFVGVFTYTYVSFEREPVALFNRALHTHIRLFYGSLFISIGHFYRDPHTYIRVGSSRIHTSLL